MSTNPAPAPSTERFVELKGLIAEAIAKVEPLMTQLDEAREAVESAKPADKAKAEQRVSDLEAEIAPLQDAAQALENEREAIRTALYEARYAELQDQYRSAATAGIKASLRKQMNTINGKLGRPALVAGQKNSSGTVAATAALLELLD